MPNLPKHKLQTLLVLASIGFFVLVTFATVTKVQVKQEASQSFAKPQQEELEGTLGLDVAEFEDGSSSPHYYIQRNEGDKIIRTEIEYKGNKELTPGDKIKVRGKKEGDRFVVSVDDNEALLVSESVNLRIIDPTKDVESATSPITPQIFTGTKKVALILVRFANQNLPIRTPAEALNLFNGTTSGGVKHYMTENSFGNLDVSADVYGWFQLPTNFDCNVFYHLEDQILANPTTLDSVNFNNYQQIVFVAPISYGSPCQNLKGLASVGSDTGFSTAEGHKSMPVAKIQNGYYTLNTLAHELGHNFGDEHSAGLECGTDSYRTTGCTVTDYPAQPFPGDRLDPLGNATAGTFHYGPFHKQRFGWISNIQTASVVASQTYNIAPIERSGAGPHALRVNIPNTNAYFLVQNRIRFGYDATIPASGGSQKAVDGAIIQLVDSTIAGGANRSMLIDSTPGGNADSQTDFFDSAWPTNTTFNDTVHGIKITPLTKSGETLPVRVEYSSGGTSTPTPPASTSSNAQVIIAGNLLETLSIVPNTTLKRPYVSVNNGAVKFNVTNSRPVVASEKILYSDGVAITSFTELMAMPDAHLSNNYYFPWYNDVDIDTQIRVGNVSTSTANVQIYIAGQLMPCGSCTLGPGASTRVSFNVNNGPVRVTANVPIVAAERMIYRSSGRTGTPYSYSEMMGMTDRQFDTNYTYWLPWYNNVELDTQLRFGNLSASQATINVSFGGQAQPAFTLGGNQGTRRSYPNVNNGVVKITSNQPIVVAERVMLKTNLLLGTVLSYSEMMALPNKLLSNNYYFPWYEHSTTAGNLDSQLRFGNVSTNQNASINVYAGGTLLPGSPFNLGPGQSTRIAWENRNTGPIRVSSNIPIIAAQRTIYRNGANRTSFSEMMGLSAPSNILWLPWYNNVDLQTELRVGYPN